MLNLEKRIAALEASTAPTEGLTIIRRFVSPGHLDAEINHITDDQGNEWTRQDGETEEAFTDRAASQTPANPHCIKSLNGHTLELPHAVH
jgi:hypothetical protein